MGPFLCFLFAPWTYFEFWKKSLDLLEALFCKVYAYLALLDLFFLTFLPQLVSLGRPKGSKQHKRQPFFNIFRHCQNRSKALQSDFGTPKRGPQGGHFFCKGPMWAFGGRLISFFAPLLRRFWAQEGANGSLGGEQRPPLLKQTTSGQRKKLNFTLNKQ